MSESPSQTTEPGVRSLLTRTILIAGVLGGLLGGVASYAASRIFVPTKPEPAKTAIEAANEEATDDARQIAENLLSLVKNDKYDEFLTQVKNAYTTQGRDFTLMKNQFDNTRLQYPQMFGQPLHQFELLREIAFSPDLIQLVYMERYEHGGPIWRIVFYRGQDHWRIAFLGLYLMEEGANIQTTYK